MDDECRKINNITELTTIGKKGNKSTYMKWKIYCNTIYITTSLVKRQNFIRHMQCFPQTSTKQWQLKIVNKVEIHSEKKIFCIFRDLGC